MGAVAGAGVGAGTTMGSVSLDRWSQSLSRSSGAASSSDAAANSAQDVGLPVIVSPSTATETGAVPGAFQAPASTLEFAQWHGGSNASNGTAVAAGAASLTPPALQEDPIASVDSSESDGSEVAADADLVAAIQVAMGAALGAAAAHEGTPSALMVTTTSVDTTTSSTLVSVVPVYTADVGKVTV